ncbi:MAG: EVE domain-containing protein [Phycisphaerales bacterium]
MRDGETVWSGVRNPGALGHLRTMRKGDELLIYHTGDEKAVVGLGVVMGTPFEDPAAPGLNDAGAPKNAVMKVRALRAARSPVALAALKADARFKDFALVRQPRLSVMPVPVALDRAIRSLAGL